MYSPDLAIADFYLFGKIKEDLRTMKAFSREGMLDIVTNILRTISQTGLKSAFDHWIHQCHWISTHNSEYSQEYPKDD
jgi:hypothetical protein